MDHRKRSTSTENRHPKLEKGNNTKKSRKCDLSFSSQNKGKNYNGLNGRHYTADSKA